MLSPERLKASTGLAFVQLSTPGGWPREQFAVLNWYLRHRRQAAKALVVSADLTWCSSDPSAAATNPFPLWLYSESPLEYLRGLLRYGTLEEAGLRVAYAFDPKAERARPDGYWDYDPRLARNQARNPELRRPLEARPFANAPRLEQDPAEGTYIFPAADRLRDVAAGLPDDTALIVVHPPRYTHALRQPRRRQPIGMRPARRPLPRRSGAMTGRLSSTGASSGRRLRIRSCSSMRAITASPWRI